MADVVTLEISVRLRWWLKPYVSVMGAAARLMLSLIGGRRVSKFIDSQSAWLARTGIMIEDGHG